MNLPTPSFSLVGYVAAAACALGVWGGWHFGSGRWQTKYEALQAEGWQAQAIAEETARKAVEGQLSDLKTTLANNQKVSHDLEIQNAAVTADRDHTRELVRRMLASASRPSADSHPVPESPGGPPVAGAGGASSNEKLEGLLVAASEECTRNANRLDALVEQLKPQL